MVRLHDLAEPVDQDVAASNAPFVQCNSYRQGKLGKGLSYLFIGSEQGRRGCVQGCVQRGSQPRSIFLRLPHIVFCYQKGLGLYP